MNPPTLEPGGNIIMRGPMAIILMCAFFAGPAAGQEKTKAGENWRAGD
jgi:hypothetical protein